MSSRKTRLLVIFLLGFSSGLPLALITSTLQAWFAQSGMSVLATGALSLVGLPYTLRMLWAPVLDRFRLCAFGRRRSWIFAMQALLLLGFNLMAWLSPQTSGHYLAFLALVLAFFSATQDIAIDAQRIEYLPVQEHALGASLGILGYRFAMLLSGGFALVLAFYFGWPFTYRCMGLFMALCMFTTFWSKEPQELTGKQISGIAAYTVPLKSFLVRPQILPLLLFIFFYKIGESFTASTSGIVMPFLIQGLGFSIDTIGYINKMMGIIALLSGGLLAGFILMYCRLYQSLLLFGIFQALTNLLFVLLATSAKNVYLLAIAVVFDNLAAGMLSTALVAFFMRIVDQRFTATQFSFLAAISTIPRLISGPVAASLQMHLGWAGLYQLSVILALIFIPFLMLIKKQTEAGEFVQGEPAVVRDALQS